MISRAETLTSTPGTFRSMSTSMSAAKPVLSMITTPDPEEMKTFLQAFMAKFPGGESVPRPSAFDIVTEVRVVTEPAGMLPHSMSMVRKTSVTMEIEGKKSQAERVDETKTSYTYP